MKRRAIMMVAAFGLLMTALAPAATAATAGRAAPATPTCTSGYAHIQNYGLGGYIWYDGTTGKVATRASSPTNWCVKFSGIAAEFEQADTTKCITYDGSANGTGYLNETTCAFTLKQTWNIGGDGNQVFFQNGYMSQDGSNGRVLMNSPGIGDALNLDNLTTGNGDVALTELWNCSICG
jgi:hypothetical protein